MTKFARRDDRPSEDQRESGRRERSPASLVWDEAEQPVPVESVPSTRGKKGKGRSVMGTGSSSMKNTYTAPNVLYMAVCEIGEKTKITVHVAPVHILLIYTEATVLQYVVMEGLMGTKIVRNGFMNLE